MLLGEAGFKFALPLLVALVVLETLAYWWIGKRGYRAGETLASLGIAVGLKLFGLIKVGAVAAASLWIWDNRIGEVPLTMWWGLIGLFLSVEFAYYWFHRLSHEIRWMWATHAVHHSSEHLNILAAYRLGWTSFFSGAWLLFLPLMWIGFHPAAVIATLALNLLYQSWIHTDLIPKLGWLEYVLNTPSSHRVHHATNADYLDRNYGGVLITFDHMFGTYVPEYADQKCEYGLVKQVGTNNPLRIAFHEWIALWRDVRTARSFKEAAGYMFGPPGWRPNGQGRTSDVIRANWRAENPRRDAAAEVVKMQNLVEPQHALAPDQRLTR